MSVLLLTSVLCRYVRHPDALVTARMTLLHACQTYSVFVSVCFSSFPLLLPVSLFFEVLFFMFLCYIFFLSKTFLLA